MTCGIYIMYYETSDFMYYVGKSTNIENRYRAHINAIKNNYHYNKKLVALYSGTLPTYSILEVCSVFELNDREVFWISTFDSYINGLNNSPGGDGASYGENNSCALYDKETYINILMYLANTTKSMIEISKELNVEHSVVKSISSGIKHIYLKEEYPIEYAKMLAKLGTRKHGPINNDISVYQNILKLLATTDKTFNSIAIETGVELNIVKDISTGKSHLYLKEVLPVEYGLLEQKREDRKLDSSKRPILVAPDGSRYNVQVGGISNFARQYDLNPSHLCRLLKGACSTHKGWKVYNEPS